MNYTPQNYRGLYLKLVERDDYNVKRAKQFVIVTHNAVITDCKIWIPNMYVETDGSLKTELNFMWVFHKDEERRKMINKAGYKFTY